MHTINPLIGRFLCVFQELLWTCKVIEFGRSACHVTYQGPSCNPTLKFTPNIMTYSQCGRKAMRRCCHSTESIANFFIKNCGSACTGLSTEFPNDEWTKYLISSAKGPLSGSGVSEDCRDDEAWSVTSGILSVGLSSGSLQCVALFSAINILN